MDLGRTELMQPQKVFIFIAYYDDLTWMQLNQCFLCLKKQNTSNLLCSSETSLHLKLKGVLGTCRVGLAFQRTVQCATSSWAFHKPASQILFFSCCLKQIPDIYSSGSFTAPVSFWGGGLQVKWRSSNMSSFPADNAAVWPLWPAQTKVCVRLCVCYQIH